MKPTIYFHIGLHKTGTSAIQAFCALNADTLLQHNLYYPDFPTATQAYQSSCGNGLRFCAWYERYDVNRKDQAMCEILSQNQQNIILSSEFFCHNTAQNWRDLLSDDYNIKIIVYLRNQPDQISSLLLQGIKNHKVVDIDKTVDSLIHNQITNFQTYLDMLSEVVGKENLLIRIYEKQQFNGGNIFADFLSVFGLELTSEYKMPDKVINPSLSPDYAEIKRLCNKLPFDERLIRDTFLEGLWKLSVDDTSGLPFTSENILPTGKREEITKLLAESNEAVARQYLGREDGRLFYNQQSMTENSSAIYRNLPPEKVVQTFGYICAQQQQQLNQMKDRLIQLDKQIVALQQQSIVDDSQLLKSESQQIFSLTGIKELMISEFVNCTLASVGNSLHVNVQGDEAYFTIANKISLVAGNSYAISVNVKSPVETLFGLSFASRADSFTKSLTINNHLNAGENIVSQTFKCSDDDMIFRIYPGSSTGVYVISSLAISTI